MRIIAAILSGVVCSSFLLQGHFAIFSPSSFGRFAELPIILLYASPIVAVTFLLIGLPYVVLEQNRMSRPSSARVTVVGFVLGLCVQGSILAVTKWAGPGLANTVPWLLAGGVGGAAPVWVYLRLTLFAAEKLEPNGATNGSQPNRSEMNSTSSTAGSGR